jgi:hypothetical protein
MPGAELLADGPIWAAFSPARFLLDERWKRGIRRWPIQPALRFERGSYRGSSAIAFSRLTSTQYANIIVSCVSRLITANFSSSLTTRRVTLRSHLLGVRFIVGPRIPARAAAEIAATVRYPLPVSPLKGIFYVGISFSGPMKSWI